jgi:uncharacterized membrane protein YczE
MIPDSATFSIGPIHLYRVRDPRAQRIRQVLVGLPFFGLALALSVEASLGVNPWTVFHGGVAERTPLTIGTATVLTGVVLLFSFPFLREPMGIGTLLNVAIIGFVVDAVLWIIPDLTSMPIRIAALAVSPALIGLGSGLYIGAGLGPGPRDGLMTALERRGLPVWLARTLIEFTALLVGWLLGGDVGLGTVWMAGSVGWFVDFFLRRLRLPD